MMQPDDLFQQRGCRMSSTGGTASTPVNPNLAEQSQPDVGDLDRQLHILVSAYACEPHVGSEPGVGWGVATALAQHHRVLVVTCNLHEAAIEKELANNPRPNLTVAYCRLPRILDWCAWTDAGHTVRYYLWQLGVARSIFKLRRQMHFDVIQHVTYVRYWQPNVLALLPIPFVFGPVGGGEATPASFRSTFSISGRIKDAFRDFGRKVAEYDPLLHLTIRFSAMTLATTPATAVRLHALGSNEIGLLTEAALPEDEIESLAASTGPSQGDVRFISMGRLLHWKGFHLGLSAFARASTAGAEYWIVGDGPERATLERQVRSAGLQGRVRFFGEVPRKEALQLLSAADVLVHPSLHDSGGWVCLEAMAARKPVLCLDLGGPGRQVTSQTGVKVAAVNPEQAIGDLARAMERLVGDPELRQSMGHAGYKRVKEYYTWDRKIKLHLDCFASVCSTRPIEDPSRAVPMMRRTAKDVPAQDSRDLPAISNCRDVDSHPATPENWEIFFPPSTRVVALPSWERPRLLVPAASLAERTSASAFYPSFRGRGQLLLLRLKAALALGARYSSAGTPSLLKEFLEDVYPTARVRAIQVGSNASVQKYTLQLEEETGQIVAYVKCAGDPLARKRLNHEFTVLSSLPGDVGPSPVKYGSVAGYDALVLKAVQGRRLRSTPALSAPLRIFSRSLLMPRNYSLESHPWILTQTSCSGEVARLFEKLVHRQWPVAIQHGDLAPWNLIEGRDGQLTAVDWEYGLECGFPGLDLAQYVLQVARLIYRWHPEKARQYAMAQLLHENQMDLTPNEAAAVVAIAAHQAYQNTADEGYLPTDWAQLWRRAIWEAAI
jgi:glycosyltransferase involved in cell wall biosynthesis